MHSGPRGAATDLVRHARARLAKGASLRRRVVGGIIAARAGGPVGVVARLWRYPVKSMAAEAITSAYVSWAGLAGDRKWAFVRPASSHNGFPWLTIRDNPAMSGCVPTLLDPERPDKSAVHGWLVGFRAVVTRASMT